MHLNRFYGEIAFLVLPRPASSYGYHCRLPFWRKHGLLRHCALDAQRQEEQICVTRIACQTLITMVHFSPEGKARCFYDS